MGDGSCWNSAGIRNGRPDCYHELWVRGDLAVAVFIPRQVVLTSLWHRSCLPAIQGVFPVVQGLKFSCSFGATTVDTEFSLPVLDHGIQMVKIEHRCAQGWRKKV